MTTPRAIIALFVCGVSVAAQPLDSANFGTKPVPSLLDNAESQAEREAFADLMRATEPKQKRFAALAFVNRFPSSWLLATAWQFAAAASVDLNDQAGVVEYGRRSIGLIRENPLLLIAIARAEVIRGEQKQAKSDAREALRWLSVLAGPGGVAPAEWDATRSSLEQYARRIVSSGEKASAPPATGAAVRFAGSASCEPCHKAAYDAWQQTGMGKMLRPLRDAVLLADFSRPVEFGKARMGGDDLPFFEFRVGGGWKRYPVDYVIGSKWQQAYATKLPDGRLFVFPLQYNTITKEWFNYWQIIDPPASERAQVGHFPNLTEATSYQRNCAVCHTSQLQTPEPAGKLERAEFREPGINCEMCHGASAQHVEQMKSGKVFARSASVPPLRFSSMDPMEATLICGQCHRQSAVRRVGTGGEMNFTSRDPFFVRLPSDTSPQYSPRAVYKDGRFRETTFIGEAFMRSACFLRGQAQCASCHNPHPADASSNPVSLKFRRDPDMMCLQCHGEIRGQISLHTRHPPESAGSRCTACHMPPIMNALLFRAASHQISDIPRADLAARFGPGESPNACLICHKDKDVTWLTARLAEYSRKTGE